MKNVIQEQGCRPVKIWTDDIEDEGTPENIDAVVQEAAKQALDAAVKQEVRDYFGRWNANGRIAVREAVIEFLDEQYPVKQVGE